MAANRQQDDQLLGMIRLRATGRSLSQVAQRFGQTTANVSTQTNKVMDADLAASGGEDINEISAAYWPRKKDRDNA